MKKYTCEHCGEKFEESDLNAELFSEGEYYCESCFEFLSESADEFLNG